MRTAGRWTLLTLFAMLWAGPAQAQTADEVIEKHLAAMGGRAALAKLTSEVATGTITVSVQGADLSGPIEVYNKAPNKSRSLIRLDLSQFGQADVVIDQRCDGKTAFASNSMQGDREITGNQLQNMLNERFPSALLTYKEDGAKVELVGKEKVGERDAYVLLYAPKAGSSARQYFDAETYLPIRTVMRVDSPEVGGEVEQTVTTSDYRNIGGIKVPFSIAISSSVQTVAVVLAKVEHNVPIEDAMFSRPAVK
jgi:hypothetical protein